MGMIALNLFSEDVDSLNNPRVQEFKSLLENMADAYKTKLRTFAIHKGKVIFSVNDEEMCDDLLDDFEKLTGQRPKIMSNDEDFVKQFKEEFERPK